MMLLPRRSIKQSGLAVSRVSHPTDNATEFSSNSFDQWADKRGIERSFIAPGRRVEHAKIESFNGELRDECLNMHCHESSGEAKRLNAGGGLSAV